jgi:chromosome segregation ATPase
LSTGGACFEFSFSTRRQNLSVEERANSGAAGMRHNRASIHHKGARMQDAAATSKPPDRLDAALRRLAAALDKLEAAGERRAKADLARGNLEEELAVLQDDRARLAVELDGAIARAKSLEAASEEVGRRLNRASAEIKAVLSAATTREA